MKKTYEKPVLMKAAVLTKVTALDTCPSGYVFADQNGSAACEPEGGDPPR